MRKIIVAQKQMNLSRLIVVQPGNSGRTFADWCREKASLSPEAKHTVEVLLKQAGTTECDAANQKLSSLTELNLGGNQISDIKPLQSLTNLTSLSSTTIKSATSNPCKE
jgi:Leucine-rich repeat (LRR) protein